MWMLFRLLTPRGAVAAAIGATAVVGGLVALEPRRVVAVDHVPDGDTLVLVGGERIRVLGVDTPELHPCACERECRLGRDARDLVAIAVSQGVTLARRGRDRYGRTLAEVRLAGGGRLADVLIGAGLGRAYSGGTRTAWCEPARS